MQNVEPYKRDNVLFAFFSVEAAAAVVCMSLFGLTIPNFETDPGIAVGPQCSVNLDVVKQASELKPWRLADEGQAEAASHAASELVRAKSHDMVANICAGNVLFIIGARNEGLKYLKKGVALSHRNKYALENYAQRLEQNGSVDEAIGQYKGVSKIDPLWEEPHLELARLYFDQDHPAECADELANVLRLNEKNFAARKLRGIALARASQYKPGLDEYNMAMQQENQNGMPDAVKQMLGAAGAGAVDRIVYELQQQVNNRPDEYVPKLKLAQLDAYLGNAADAKLLLMDARRLAPNNPEVHRTLAIVLKQLGEDNQAISSFGLSVKLEQQQEHDKKASQQPLAPQS